MDELKSFGVVVDLGSLPGMISRIKERNDELYKDVLNLQNAENTTLKHVESLDMNITRIESDVSIIRETCSDATRRIDSVHSNELSTLSVKAAEMHESMQDVVARVHRMVLDLRACEKDLIELRLHLRTSDERVSEALTSVQASASDWRLAKESVDLFTVSAETMCGKFRVMQENVGANCDEMKSQILSVKDDVVTTLTRMNFQQDSAISDLKSYLEAQISASSSSTSIGANHLLKICQKMIAETRINRRDNIFRRNLIHIWHSESMRVTRTKLSMSLLLRLFKSALRKAMHEWRNSVKLLSLEERLISRFPNVEQAIVNSSLSLRFRELEHKMDIKQEPTAVNSDETIHKLVAEQNRELSEMKTQIAELADTVAKMATNHQLDDIHRDSLLMWNNMKQIDTSKVDTSQVERIVVEHMDRAKTASRSEIDKFDKLAEMIAGLQKCLSQRQLAHVASPLTRDTSLVHQVKQAEYSKPDRVQWDEEISEKCNGVGGRVVLRPGSAQTSARKNLSKSPTDVDLLKQHTDIEKNLEVRGIRPGSAVSNLVPPTTAGFLLQRVTHAKK